MLASSLPESAKAAGQGDEHKRDKGDGVHVQDAPGSVLLDQ